MALTRGAGAGGSGLHPSAGSPGALQPPLLEVSWPVPGVRLPPPPVHLQGTQPAARRAELSLHSAFWAPEKFPLGQGSQWGPEPTACPQPSTWSLPRGLHGGGAPATGPGACLAKQDGAGGTRRFERPGTTLSLQSPAVHQPHPHRELFSTRTGSIFPDQGLEPRGPARSPRDGILLNMRRGALPSPEPGLPWPPPACSGRPLPPSAKLSLAHRTPPSSCAGWFPNLALRGHDLRKNSWSSGFVKHGLNSHFVS